ncbi:hypothetical protein ACQVBX_09015 [Dyella sp. KULCS107]|uniref:hypothetical protein n=1 Tax=Dyella sp. KULCS107 TaxID=3422216 RepID=UPI003D6F6D69
MSLPRYPEYTESGISWLGEMPAHWDERRTKYLFDLMKRPVRDEDEIVTAFRDGQVTLRGNRRTDGFTNALQEIGYQGVRRGDLVIHAMDAFAGAIGVSDSDGKSTPVYSVCRPKMGTTNSHYYAHVLRYMAIGGFIASLAKGIRERSTDFRWADAGSLLLPMPPLKEQEAIVAFLDRETAKIDALIAEQEKLLALLAEKRQATISHAVTRGLNPNVPLKDSGIPWLGEVPAHWDVMALGRVTVSKCDGPFGSGLKSDHYVEEGARVIRLQNIRGGRFDDRDAAFIELGYFESEMARHEVREGDLLIGGLGDDNNVVGRACVAPEHIYPALVKADCFRFRLDTDRALPEFAAWALTVGATYDAGNLSSGSTRSRIPLSVMASRKIPLPPVDEQREINRSIEVLQSEFDRLADSAEQAVELLRERRSALISAAVTGKIDVRARQ